MYLVRNVVAMEKTIQRTFFHILKGSAHQAILLVVSLTAGMGPALCQTPADTDSLNAVGLSWKVDMEEARPIPEGASSRYFIAPSAHQMKRGQGRIQSNFAHNVAHLGVTDRMSISGMAGVWGAAIGLQSGWQIGERMRVGLETLWATEGRLQQVLGNEELLKKPLLLGGFVVTYGDASSHVSLGLGMSNEALPYDPFHYYSDELIDEAWRLIDEGLSWTERITPEFKYGHHARIAVLNLSAIWEVRPGFWILTENHLLSTSWFGRAEQEENNQSIYVDDYLGNTYGGGVFWPGGEESIILSMGFRNYGERSGLYWDYGVAHCFLGGFDGYFPCPWFSMTFDF